MDDYIRKDCKLVHTGNNKYNKKTDKSLLSFRDEQSLLSPNDIYLLKNKDGSNITKTRMVQMTNWLFSVYHVTEININCSKLVAH